MSTLPVTVTSEPNGRRGLVLGLAIHGDTVVAVGGQGRDLILLSTDGVSWKEVRGKGKGLRGALLRDDELWVTGEYGYLARSEDLGKTWTEIKTKTSGCLFGVVADDAGHVWVAGDDGYLAVSKNGTTFTKVAGVDESIARISASPLGVLVPSDKPGHLYVAKDGAVAKTSANAGSDLMSAVVTPAGTLITVGANGVVLRSEDRGESFEKIDLATTALLCAVECFEDGRVVVVGAKGAIFLSNDDGKTFVRVRHAASGGTFWCCRRYNDVLLAGGENGLLVTIGEPRAAVDTTPASLPVESKDGVWWSPQLRAMLYPRRGGIATMVRPVPTLEEAWSTLRRILWAADRVGMETKSRPSGIWGFASSHSKSERLMGERILDPVARIGTAEEDAALVALSYEKYHGFIADFHEDVFEAVADFLVASVGLTEALRRCYAGFQGELPYVGVGLFGRLRDLLAVADDGEYSTVRAAILASSEQAIARDPKADRHIADLRWATTFLLPLGPLAGDEERELHARALPNTVKFGDFGVHACGIAAGDLATLEHFLAKNGKVRHEFFSPFNGRMYLASVLEIAGRNAAPVLARMKPSNPFHNDATHNGLWCQLIAHVDAPQILEVLYEEHTTEGSIWGTAGLVTAARLDKERVLAFVRSKNDADLARIIEAETSRQAPPPKWRLPGSEIPEELTQPVPYEPPATPRGVAFASRVVVEPEATWRDDEREQAMAQSVYDDAVKWDGVSLRKLTPEALEAFIAHREKWRLPSAIPDFGLAPRSIHERLMALGFSPAEYAVRWMLPGVMVKNGLALLPLLRAALEDPASSEAALEVAQPFGDVAFVPVVAKAFAGKKQKALARSWLRRHPRHAIAGALALWSEGGAPAADATRVLRYLDGRGHRASILALAAAYDVAAVTRVLDEDPLAAPKVKKPTVPGFADVGALPELVTVDGEKADAKEVAELLVRLAFSNADEIHPGVIAAKTRYTAQSRAAFVWALFEAWLKSGADAKHGWCMQAVGFLGDDECARRLAALAKAWPGENASARAQAALDALLNIGTDTALVNINLLAEKSKFPAFKAAARERIDAIAFARGLTADELADRLVPTLGLEEKGATVLELGGRTFEIVFGEDLLPRVKDVDGKVHADLPKPGKNDAKDLAKAAKAKLAALKKDARTTASLQIARMERAMRSERAISASVFTSCFAEHPWMTHLARRFVWGAYEEGTTLKSSFRVAEDGSLANVDDAPFELSPEMTVKLLHPLALPKGELERWGQVFADYEILQPFLQLSRPVFTVDDAERTAKVLSRYDGRTVSYSALRGLEARGWERWYDASVQMAQRIDSKSVVVLGTEPGWHPSQTAADIEPQRIDGLHLTVDGEGFGSLPPLVFSEIVYDLETITSSS